MIMQKLEAAEAMGTSGVRLRQAMPRKVKVLS